LSNYVESIEQLSEEAKNFVRALSSLKEEVEAVSWYHQRVDSTKDGRLKGILAHNRDEEIEHACMTLEWLRRNMPGWDEQLRKFLFTEGEIGHHGDEDSSTPALKIGNLKVKDYTGGNI
jgi:ferritin-like protein